MARLPAGYVPPLPPYLPRALVGKEGEETNRLSFCFFGGREGTGHRLTPEPEVKTVFSAPPIAKSPSPLPDWAVALGNALPPAGSDREALASVLKALASGLAVGDAQDTRGHSGPTGLPENEIDDDAIGVSNPKGHDAMKTYGPYPHKNRWRILIRLGSKQKAQSFGTEAEAKAEIRRLRIEAQKQAGVTSEGAIAAYMESLRANGLKERSIETTGYRLRKLFAPLLSVPLCTLTAAQARDLFSTITGSVDSRRNILAEAKTFCRKAKEMGWTDSQLLVDVHGEGRRHFGKPKLTLDESLKFQDACLKLADSPDPKKRTAGVGSAMALIFGMRASEITGLQVRDLDAGGTIIRITRAKSQAGIRSLQVPEWFRPHLQRLAEGKKPTEPLVGRERTWLHRNVRAICRKAGITEVPPHGLRGTHADLALSAAATPLAVSKALGHESLTTTYRHYANEGITRTAEHERTLASLAPALTAPLPN